MNIADSRDYGVNLVSKCLVRIENDLICSIHRNEGESVEETYYEKVWTTRLRSKIKTRSE